jgi:transposase
VLTNLGCKVTVAQSQDLLRITKSMKKTDKNDSMELAAYMRRYLAGEEEFSVCLMPPKEWMMRREVCRVVFKEKLHLADLKRRTRAHMLLHGIRLSREYSDIFSKKAMEELKATKDHCLLIFVSEAKSIKTRTDEEAKLIRHMFNGIRMYDLILSIPGFGSVSAAYLTSIIMDIGRFGTSDEFTAYFGVVPKMSESAGRSRNCATTHRGDEDARRLLCQAAFVHARTVENSVVTRMYNRLKDRGMSHKEAQVASARKLLTVVWSVLKNDLPYTDDDGLLSRAAERETEMEDTLGS